jgi:hypothetical protein
VPRTGAVRLSTRISLFSSTHRAVARSARVKSSPHMRRRPSRAARLGLPPRTPLARSLIRTLSALVRPSTRTDCCNIGLRSRLPLRRIRWRGRSVKRGIAAPVGSGQHDAGPDRRTPQGSCACACPTLRAVRPRTTRSQRHAARASPTLIGTVESSAPGTSATSADLSGRQPMF